MRVLLHRGKKNLDTEFFAQMPASASRRMVYFVKLFVRFSLVGPCILNYKTSLIYTYFSVENIEWYYKCPPPQCIFQCVCMVISMYFLA